jgi:mRNA-degrading endonuclease toxin of MazEF toxin-antitoxin module
VVVTAVVTRQQIRDEIGMVVVVMVTRRWRRGGGRW